MPGCPVSIDIPAFIWKILQEDYRGAAQKLKEMKKNVLVVDFDPEVISTLKCQNVTCIYGDVEDSEVFEKLHFGENAPGCMIHRNMIRHGVLTFESILLRMTHE